MSTLTAPKPFVVTDAMHQEVKQILKGAGFATHAVVYPERNEFGWAFEPVSGAATARRVRKDMGAGAEVMAL